MRAYKALQVESKRHELPLTFATDLTKHDRAAIARNGETTPFFWALYDHGTHMTLCDAPARFPRSLERQARDFVALMRSMGPEARCYYWDGTALAPITSAWLDAQALGLLCAGE